MFPLTDLSILFTALLIILILCLGLILLVGLIISKRFKKHNCSVATQQPIQAILPPTTNTEAMLVNIITKIDNNHAEDVKWAKGNRIEQIAFVLWSFALASLGLAVAAFTMQAYPATIGSSVAAIWFFLFGQAALVHLRKYKNIDWHNFWDD